MPQKGRKILYILGAGASVAAGAYTQVQAGHRITIPTQGDFWDVFLRLSRSKYNKRMIENFLFQYFLGYERAPSNADKAKKQLQLKGIDVEEVFTFLSERVRAKSTSPQLRRRAEKVWIALVEELGNVFWRFRPNEKSRKIYRRLMDNYVRSRDVFVSFNYDTVFEHSLPSSNWCYDCIDNKPDRMRILKPHGSINWEMGKRRIKIRNHPELSVIVAPTHLKFVRTDLDEEEDADEPSLPLPGYLDQSPQILEIWESMEREMRLAKALVFIGYSFPVADLYFSSVLRSVLASRSATPAVVIVNPDAVAIGRRLQARFPIDTMLPYFDLSMFLQNDRDQLLRQI